MRKWILSVALVLSMLAAAFVSLPAKAAVDFTGNVMTTDSVKAPKDVYVRGQGVYVVCEVLYLEVHTALNIEVRLEEVDGGIVSHFHTAANLPVDGWYNSSEVGGLVLWTGGAPIPWDQDRDVFYVVLEEDSSGYEIARTAITILKEGFTLDPQPGPVGSYTPGQTLTAKLITRYTSDVLYVHTVNSTGVDVPGMNWTMIIAVEGFWEKSFVLSTDIPDGTYLMNVRDATTHALRYSIDFSVQKYALFTMSERSYYLIGETAVIHYLVIDAETLTEYAGASVSYQAYWINSSGVDTYESGSLPGSSGNHSMVISSDVASYSDVWLTYWANESGPLRSSESSLTLYTGQLAAQLWLSDSEVTPGYDIEVQLEASVNWEMIPGAIVNVTVELDGTPVDGYGATGLLTDHAGQAYHSIAVSNAASPGTYIVKATVSKAGQAVLCVDSFVVQNVGWIEIEMDKDYYLSGDTALVYWRTIWNGEEVTGSEVSYILLLDSTGPVMGTDSSGVISIPLPVDFVGTLGIELFATLDGNSILGVGWTFVIPAELRLYALCSSYRPGDVLEFGYDIATNLPSAELKWEVLDEFGFSVANGTPAFSKSGVFSYSVPTLFASVEYRAEITLLSQSVVVGSADAFVSMGPEPPLIPAPYIVLDSPTEGATTSVATVGVRGTTESGVLVTVNGQYVSCDTSGSFSTVINLVEGVNLITVTAEDGMGNTRTVTRNVTFENLIPDLQTQLAEIISDLSGIQTDLAFVLQQIGSIGDDMAAAWNDLNESRQNIESMWADMNASDALLAALQIELDGLRLELTTTHSDLNSTQVQLEMIDALQAQLDITRAYLNTTMAELEAAQTQLDSVESDLEQTQGEVQDTPSSSTVMMWAAIAVVLSIVVSLVVSVLMRKRAQGS